MHLGPGWVDLGAGWVDRLMELGWILGMALQVDLVPEWVDLGAGWVDPGPV